MDQVGLSPTVTPGAERPSNQPIRIRLGAGGRTASQLESLAIESGPVLGNYYLKRIGWIEEVEPSKSPKRSVPSWESAGNSY